MLTSVQMQEFEEQGFVRLGQVATGAEVEAMRRRIDAIMLGEAPRDGIWFQLDQSQGSYETLKVGNGGFAGPSLNYRKIQGLENDPVFSAYLRHPTFRDLTRRLIGANVTVFRAMFMNKPALGGTVLPYHQDGGTQWELSQDPFVTVWTALDPSTVASGCVQVIPGSHRLGLLSARGHTITAAQEAEYAPDDRSLYLEAQTGEVLLLHNYLLHRSAVNHTAGPRRAFSVCYMDAATTSAAGARPLQFPVAFTG